MTAVKRIGEWVRRDPGLALLVISVLAVIAVYAPTLHFGLVNYDDPWLVRDNWILRDASWSSLETVFFDLHSPRRFVLSPEYLPVRDLSIMLDFAIWGDHYEGFHLTNLVVYLVSIVTWFSALSAFGVDRKLAGVAVLVWALHPSHAESVAWITERKGLLAVMFAGIAAFAYARYRAGRSAGWLAGWLALAAAMAVCAVWSKATGAFAIAALAGLELVLPAARVSWRRSLVGLGVIGVVAAAAFVPVVVLAADASVVGAAQNPPAGRLAMVLGVHGFDLRASALAVANAVSYPLSSQGPSALDLILGGFGLAALVAVLALRRGPRELRAGAVVWLAGWLPASHLILPLKMIFVADRYLLFPTLGFALIVAVGISRVPRPAIRNALLAAIVLASAFRTLSAQANWRDAQTLWAAAVASNPADGEAWGMYAEAVAERGGDAEAVVAEGLRHTSSPRLVHRQALLVLPRDRPRAIALLRDAARGGEAIAMSNLALLLQQDGAIDEAVMWARSAAASRPTAHAYRTLGKVELAAGHADAALPAFEHALAVEPTCANHFNVALALVALDRPGAISHLDRCVNDPQVGGRARELRGRAR